jgi:divalent metal cation (Fe/Co/Zn/Cd) transporter
MVCRCIDSLDCGIGAGPFSDDAKMKREGWSTTQIALALYPFAAGAAGVNVFFAFLMGSWIGLPVVTTGWSIIIGCIVGIPVTRVFAGHIRSLMDQAQPKDRP